MRTACERVALVGIALMGAVGAAATADGPTVQFRERLVTVHSIAPGSQAVLLGVAYETTRYVSTSVTYLDSLHDTTGDGAVELEVDEAIPRSSLWVAIDVATGDSTVAAPDGSPIDEISLPLRDLAPGLDWLDLDLPIAHVLLVRPGAGAWHLHVGDGGASDADGLANGTIRVALANMRSVGTGRPAPARFSTDDVLVVIDPNWLRLMRVRL